MRSRWAGFLSAIIVVLGVALFAHGDGPAIYGARFIINGVSCIFNTPCTIPGSTGTAIAGDVTGTLAASSVVKVNGAAVPASKTSLGSNSSGQLVAASAGINLFTFNAGNLGSYNATSSYPTSCTNCSAAPVVLSYGVPANTISASGYILLDAEVDNCTGVGTPWAGCTVANSGTGCILRVDLSTAAQTGGTTVQLSGGAATNVLQGERYQLVLRPNNSLSALNASIFSVGATNTVAVAPITGISTLNMSTGTLYLRAVAYSPTTTNQCVVSQYNVVAYP